MTDDLTWGDIRYRLWCLARIWWRAIVADVRAAPRAIEGAFAAFGESIFGSLESWSRAEEMRVKTQIAREFSVKNAGKVMLIGNPNLYISGPTKRIDWDNVAPRSGAPAPTGNRGTF